MIGGQGRPAATGEPVGAAGPVRLLVLVVLLALPGSARADESIARRIP